MIYFQFRQVSTRNIGLFLCICTQLMCIALSEKCVKEPGHYCRCRTSRETISLEPYAVNWFKEQKSSKEDDKNKYSYNPCLLIGEETDCGAAVLLHDPNGAVTRLGSFLKFDFEGDLHNGGLRIEYHAGNKTANVSLECGQNPQFQPHGPSPTNANVYGFTLITPFVCVEENEASSGGLSVGSILVIVFFVLVLVYLVGGVLYLRLKHGARGLEQIPNYDFWVDLPSLIKDGAVFVSRGCKPEPSYQQI